MSWHGIWSNEEGGDSTFSFIAEVFKLVFLVILLVILALLLASLAAAIFISLLGVWP